MFKTSKMRMFTVALFRMLNKDTLSAVIFLAAIAIIVIVLVMTVVHGKHVAPAAPVAAVKPALSAEAAEANSFAHHVDGEENYNEPKRTPESDTLGRKTFAKSWEETELGNGHSADVFTGGKNATTITYRYPLVTKSFVYIFCRDEANMFDAMRALGFKKFIMTDGFDDAWTWDLTKKGRAGI